MGGRRELGLVLAFSAILAASSVHAQQQYVGQLNQPTAGAIPEAAPSGQTYALVPAPYQPPPAKPGVGRPVVPAPVKAPPASFVFAVIGILGAVGVFALFSIYGALRSDRRWSLADALSEECELPLRDVSNAPVVGGDGKILMAPTLVASSSRLIALLGLIGMLSLYLGFGVSILYYFASGQGVPPGSDHIQNFLIAGVAMFAPYVINKFASVFESFTYKPK